jgi:hypothetical protein
VPENRGARVVHKICIYDTVTAGPTPQIAQVKGKIFSRKCGRSYLRMENTVSVNVITERNRVCGAIMGLCAGDRNGGPVRMVRVLSFSRIHLSRH